MRGEQACLGTFFANKKCKLRAPLSHWTKTYTLVFLHEYTFYWKPERTSSPLPQALGENWRKCLLEDAKEAETHLWIPSGQTHGTTNFLNFAFLWSPLWSLFLVTILFPVLDSFGLTFRVVLLRKKAFIRALPEWGGVGEDPAHFFCHILKKCIFGQ